jgi:tetratricopeptide (TPR) repeat protein
MVPPLLQRAEVLYASRNPVRVREAGQVWLEAARADATRIEGLIGAARSYVWLVDHEPVAADREKYATLAVQSAQWCERVKPDDPGCAYWLGAALGVQARERRSTALDALPLIEAAFKKAAGVDPEMEEGGPDRALALLYLRAPGWPSGPGDPDLGLAHARRAVEIKPDHPPNQMALAEALVATGDAEAGRAMYRRALEAARQREAAGDPDAPDWIREADGALADKTNGS